MTSGLLNPQTGMSYNAWERSKAFPKVMKHKRGPQYQLPNTQGESLSLSTPQTHELFVKYCQSCVGIVNFVRCWNHQVEDSLSRTAESQAKEREITNLKQTIADLNEFIGVQENRLCKAEYKYTQLEESSKFMSQWTYQQEMQGRSICTLLLLLSPLLLLLCLLSLSLMCE